MHMHKIAIVKLTQKNQFEHAFSLHAESKAWNFGAFDFIKTKKLKDQVETDNTVAGTIFQT